MRVCSELAAIGWGPRAERAAVAWLALAALTASMALLGEEGAARAAEPEARRVVVVIDISADSAAHAAIEHDVSRALRKNPAWVVKDLNDVLNAGGEVEDRTNIGTAQSFREAGERALEASDALDAIDQLESATQLMEKSYAFLRDPADYGDALLLLGRARLESGDAAGARATLEKAAMVRADPARVTLDAATASRFEEVRAEVEALPLGAVEVVTEPPYAEVYVDGRFKGITPTTVAGLTEGTHLLSLFKAGSVRQTGRARVSSAGLGHAEFELAPARRQLLLTQLRERLPEEVRSALGPERVGGDGVRDVGGLLASENALVVRSTGPRARKEVSLFLFDTRTLRLLSHVSGTIDWSYRNRRAVAELVERVLDFDYAVALGGTSQATATKPDEAEDGGIIEAWWFWTIIGAVVVGGATAGIVVGTQPKERSPYGKDGTGAVVLQF